MSLENDEAAQRKKFEALIRSYARILAIREPNIFTRRATEYADEDGHYDSSYPPRQVYRCCTGPKLYKVRGPVTCDVATEKGFYYSWKRVTEHPGIYVAADGKIWGCEEIGTGSVGSFAAHPGDTGVMVEIEWSPRNDVLTSELREVEAELRKLAFPLTQAA